MGTVLFYAAVLLTPAELPPHGVPPAAGSVELAPFPRAVAPAVAFVAVPGGYQVRLNRETTAQLRDALDQADPKDIARLLSDRAKAMREGLDADPDTANSLDLAAFLVVTQLPGFQNQLRDKAGPGGVVITVTGLQADTVPFLDDRPRLNRVAGLVRGAMPLLPPEARDAVEAVRAVARTTPTGWTVEPLP